MGYRLTATHRDFGPFWGVAQDSTSHLTAVFHNDGDAVTIFFAKLDGQPTLEQAKHASIVWARSHGFGATSTSKDGWYAMRSRRTASYQRDFVGWRTDRNEMLLALRSAKVPPSPTPAKDFLGLLVRGN